VSNLLNAIEAAAITLWVGSLWAVGYLAVPTLFANLPDRVLAGALAGKLFGAVAWIGIGCGALLLVVALGQSGAAALRQGQSWVIGAMLALTLAGHFGVQPVLQRLKDEVAPAPVMESANRGAFARWHGVSSGLYLVQSVLGLALVVMRARGVN
jgi:hypothetical protein